MKVKKLNSPRFEDSSWAALEMDETWPALRDQAVTILEDRIAMALEIMDVNAAEAAEAATELAEFLDEIAAAKKVPGHGIPGNLYGTSWGDRQTTILEKQSTAQQNFETAERDHTRLSELLLKYQGPQ